MQPSILKCHKRGQILLQNPCLLVLLKFHAVTNRPLHLKSTFLSQFFHIHNSYCYSSPSVCRIWNFWNLISRQFTVACEETWLLGIFPYKFYIFKTLEVTLNVLETLSFWQYLFIKSFCKNFWRKIFSSFKVTNPQVWKCFKKLVFV